MKRLMYISILILATGCSEGQQADERQILEQDSDDLPTMLVNLEPVESDEVRIDEVSDTIVPVQGEVTLSNKMPNPEDGEPSQDPDGDYVAEMWKDVPNPFIATYNGNMFGDYFHIEFEDSDGNYYDFGDGNNYFGDYPLYHGTEQYDENLSCLGKEFIVTWEWKMSEFPCCEGEYNLTRAKRPSITGLELSDKQKAIDKKLQDRFERELLEQWKGVDSIIEVTFVHGLKSVRGQHELVFEDDNHEYDFGISRSNLHGIRFLQEGEPRETNYKLIGKKYRIEWKWLWSNFLGAVGGDTKEYAWMGMKVPTIVKIELIE